MAYAQVIKAVQQAILESKKSVIDELLQFLDTKLEIDDQFKAFVSEFKNSLKVDVMKDAATTTKKPKIKRAPTAYNMFISERMKELKPQHPNANSKELMSMATKLWKEQKSKQ